MRWIDEYLRVSLFKLGETDVTPLSLILFAVTLIVVLLVARGTRALIVGLLGKRTSASVGAAYAVGRIVQYLIVVGGVMLGLENVGVSLTALAAFGAFVSSASASACRTSPRTS